METDAAEPEPGYCLVCGEFHLITPVPGYAGRGVCSSQSCRQRLDPPEPYVPGARHVCGVGGELKAGHSEYRQCRCGQWYSWGGSMWYPVSHPSRKWLHEHGADAPDLWTLDDEKPPFAFGEFFTSIGRFRYLLRYLLRS